MNIPADYASASVYDLLQAASRGLIGLDRRFLHALVDDPARSLPDLLRFGLEDHEDDPVDLEPELLAVFRYLKTPAAMPYYLDCLRRQTEDADDDLIEGVIALGAGVLEPLVDLYRELGEEQGSEVAFVLAGLGVRDQRILELLLERLEYDAADGALCLGLYGDPAAIPAIEKMIGDVAGDDELKRELADAIEEIRNHGQRHMETAGEFELFAHYPEEAGPDFDSLADADRMLLLSHDSPEIRAQAARSFFQQKFPLEIRARLLEIARSDDAPHVRGRAWEALADIDDKELRSEMLRRATAPETDPDERAGLLVALAEDAEKPGIRAGIIELYEYPNTRAKALEAMWRSFDRDFARYFPAHLGDADQEIRRQAIMGAGYLGIGAEAERLRSSLRTRSGGPTRCSPTLSRFPPRSRADACRACYGKSIASRRDCQRARRNWWNWRSTSGSCCTASSRYSPGTTKMTFRWKGKKLTRTRMCMRRRMSAATIPARAAAERSTRSAAARRSGLGRSAAICPGLIGFQAFNGCR